MMAITGGRARSFAEIETLLSRSGFKLSGVTATSRGLSVIEAI
jgi:hypothetical protein